VTSREREVLHFVAKGLTNNEIATRLGIDLQTAEIDSSNLIQKLELQTEADLIRFALRQGIDSWES
jgi:two-component system response regulator NreC